MNSNDRLDASIVLVHAAWADASSWNKVILPLRERGWKVVSAQIPLTSLSDDLAALRRVVERTRGPVVLAGHSYAGAVITALDDDRVKALVYIAGMAPERGETVGSCSTANRPMRKLPPSRRMSTGLSGCRKRAFAARWLRTLPLTKQSLWR